MTEGEAEEFIRVLNGSLAEVGAVELGDQVRRAARSGEEEMDSRAHLSLLLDELESVLVDAPKMLKTTMAMLGAESLTLTTDPSDIRFQSKGLRTLDAAPEDADGITITANTLQPLLGNAEKAAGMIAELRRRVYE